MTIGNWIRKPLIRPGVALSLLAILASTALVQAKGSETEVELAKETDLVETAIGAGSFKTLAAALAAAGLVN